jgi:hypothetical protein
MSKNFKNLNIELTEKVGRGMYANLVVINHSQSEFILDFIQVMPNVPKAKVKSRIILNPQHAKSLISALQENVKKFESEFGSIQNRNSNLGNNINFLTPLGEA